MDKLRQFGYQAHPVRCHACAAMAREAKSMSNKPHDDAGLRFAVSPIDEVITDTN